MKYFLVSYVLLAGFLPAHVFAQTPAPATNTQPAAVAPANMTNAATNAMSSNVIPAMEDPAVAEKRISNWTETLSFGISSQRLSVVKQIRSMKETNMIPALQEHFFKENTLPVKEEIVYIFIEATNTDAGFWQKVFTEEKDIVALQRAAYAVEQMKAPDVGGQLYARLTNDLTNDKAMRFNANAVRALGELKYQAALPTITEIATNKDLHQDYRGSAVLALGIFKDSAQLGMLTEMLTNILEPRTIRRYAAIGIGRLESPEAFEVLAPIATNETEDQSLRTGAIMGLAYTESTNKLAVMEALSKSDNATLRTEAVRGLGRINSEASQTILKYKAFKDPEAIVRREARTALQALGVDVDLLDQQMRNTL